jgi:hypothetical protein
MTCYTVVLNVRSLDRLCRDQGSRGKSMAVPKVYPHPLYGQDSLQQNWPDPMPLLLLTREQYESLRMVYCAGADGRLVQSRPLVVSYR